MSITLSQPISGKSSNEAPQAAPALFTKILSLVSLSLILVTNLSISFMSVKSAGMEIHSPYFESSFAFLSQGSDFLEEIYVFTPLRTKPSAIIAPIPLDPPVTSAILPFKLNKFSIFSLNVNYINY